MAIQDAELRIVLRAVGGDLLNGMQEVRAAVDRTTAQIQSDFARTERSVQTSVEGIGAKVKEGFHGVEDTFSRVRHVAETVFAALAGRALFGEIIEQTQSWAKESERLAFALGISFEKASVFAVAAREAGVPIETIEASLRGLAQTINTNEAAFGNLGISIRDSNHELLPFEDILQRTIERLEHYRAGVNQTAAAQQVFRRATPETVRELREVVDNLDHARKVATDFGIAVGSDGVAKAKQFERAQADLGLALLGVGNVITTALRPELESLIGNVAQLASDGSLDRWATQGAAVLTDVIGLFTRVGAALIEHIELVKAGAAAWLGYKAAVSGVAAATGLLEFLGVLDAVRTRIQGLAAISVGAGLSNLGASIAASRREAQQLNLLLQPTTGQLQLFANTAAAAGPAVAGAAVGVSRLATAAAFLTGNLGIIIPVLAATAAAVLQYAGAFDVASDAVSHADEKLRLLRAQADREHSLTDTPVEHAQRKVGEARGYLAIAELEVRSALKYHGESSKEYAAALGEQATATDRLRFAEEALRTFEKATESAPKPVNEGDAAAAVHKRFEELRKEQAVDLAASERNEAAKLEIVKRYSAQIFAIQGLAKTDHDAQLADLNAAERRAADERIRIRVTELQQKAKEVSSDVDQTKRGIETTLRLGKIGAAEAIAQENALAATRRDAQLAALEEQRRLAEGNLLEQARLAAATRDIWAEYNREVLENSRRAEEVLLEQQRDNAARLGQAFGSVSSGLNTALDAAIEKTRSSAEVMADILTGFRHTAVGIVEDIVGTFLKKSAVDALSSGQETAAEKQRTLDEQLAAELSHVAAGLRQRLALVKAEADAEGAVRAGRPTGGTEPPPTPEGGEFVGPPVPTGLGSTPASTDANASLADTYANLAAQAQAGEALLTQVASDGNQQRTALESVSLAGQLASWVSTNAGKVASTLAANAKTIGSAVQTAARWIATELGMTSATVAGESTRTAAKAQGVAADTTITALKATTANKSIVTDAAAAASSAYSWWVEQLGPVYGAIAGAIAAAAVFAVVLGYKAFVSSAGGLDAAPGDALHMLHPRETVLSPGVAASVRAFAADPGSSAVEPGAFADVGDEPILTTLPKGAMVVPASLADAVREMVSGRSGGARAASARGVGVTAAGGLERVGADGTPAELHRDEAVLPADVASTWRQAARTLAAARVAVPAPSLSIAGPSFALSGVGAAGDLEGPGSSATAEVHHHPVAVSISAMDGESVDRFIKRNRRKFAEAVAGDNARHGRGRTA